MRYLPLTETDRRAMLGAIGVPSVDSLFRDVPLGARLDGPVDLPLAIGELEVERAHAAEKGGPARRSHSASPRDDGAARALPWLRARGARRGADRRRRPDGAG